MPKEFNDFFKSGKYHGNMGHEVSKKKTNNQSHNEIVTDIKFFLNELDK